MTNVEEVRRYYIQRWGEPSREQPFRDSQRNAVSVLKWGKDLTKEDVAIYATLGASEHPLAGDIPMHRFEFFLGFEPDNDEVMEHLALAATYPMLAGTSVNHGHTITFQEPLWRGSPMSTFLILRGIGVVLPPLSLSNGCHVDFLEVVPLFDYELKFKRLYGTASLLERWRDIGTPFWNPGRHPEASLRS